LDFLKKKKYGSQKGEETKTVLHYLSTLEITWIKYIYILCIANECVELTTYNFILILYNFTNVVVLQLLCV